MPTFAFTARDSSGRPVSGTLAASNAGEVLQALRSEGKFPVAVKVAEPSRSEVAAGTIGRRGIKVSRAEVIQFSMQLSIMVETGVQLSEALDCIARQADKPALRNLVADLSEQLQAGTSLSEALARHPRSFPRLYVALIRASEKSGMLSRLLTRATGYLRDEQETLRRVKGALTYPMIMFLFAMGTTIFLLTFVMPRFTVIYAMKKAALPAPTQILMNVSDLLVNHWPPILAGVIGLVIATAMGLRTSTGARTWHYIQLHAPLFGKLYRKLHLTRGLRMVGTMAGAGVNLMDCVNTAHDLCDNSYFRDLWQQVANQIQVGRQLSDPLFDSPLVPRGVSQMIFSGEKSGKLAGVMEQVASYAETELKEQIAALTRYIEPAMIVIMGAIIGSVSLALLLPIFSISKVMAQ